MILKPYKGGQNRKRNFKRWLSFLLALTLVLGMIPNAAVTVQAAEIGDTHTQSSNDPSELPVLEDGQVWSGPESVSVCSTPEHSHSNSCYLLTCDREIGLYHWWHSYSCYDHDQLVCTQQVHQHSSSCRSQYRWTVVSTQDAQWRNWWPVYWGYDTGSVITDLSAVQGVIANNGNMGFTSTGVRPADGLEAVENHETVTVGDALHGVTVEMSTGYYVTAYRFVCGNHTDCGVTSYDDRVHTPNNAGNYTASFSLVPSTSEFDHWDNVGELTTNTDAGRNTNYIPWDAPDADDNNIYSSIGSNVVYPFYLLLEVQQDNETYNVTYNWGDLADQIGAEVPEGDTGLLRNASHTVEAPGTDAIAAAAALGYEFVGWQVVATGYNAEAMVQPGNTVTIYGSDITLVAQWAKNVTVSYVYEGEVPADAPTLPGTETYTEGETVAVEDAPTLTGYTFSGWETDDAQVKDGQFTMPGTPVVFTGSWEKDETQTHSVSYTVQYWFNGVMDENETEVVTDDYVWINDNTIPFDEDLMKTFEDWTYVFSDPEDIPANVPNGTVINLYYTGSNPEIGIEKNVSAAKAKVGDTLTYTIYRHKQWQYRLQQRYYH